jgi:Galactose oxidase, central domain
MHSADMLQADAALRASLGRQASSAVSATGDILIVGGGFSAAENTGQSTVAAEFYSVKSKKFEVTGALLASRIGITPVVVRKGALRNHVLVAGGVSGKATANSHSVITLDATDLDTVEIYNPGTGQFAAYAHQLNEERSYYTATPLHDDTILIAGGFSSSHQPLDEAELFDPTTGMFLSPFFMNENRALQTATLLPDGSILVVGGVADQFGDTSGTAEIYDPRLHTFTPTKGLLPDGIRLAGQTATLIAGCHCTNDGKVLLAGGFSGGAFEGTSIETAANTLLIYDPKTQTFAKAADQMTDYRVGHTATLLPDGNILLAGGATGQFAAGTNNFGIYGTYLDSAELFDAATGQVTCIGGTVVRDKTKMCASSMVNARVGHIAALIHSGPMAGRVLLAGGAGGVAEETNRASTLTTAEVFDPATGKFTAAASLNAAHAGAGTAIVP